METPATLLERLRNPEDQGAWAQFVELFTPLLLHWAGQVGLQEADAADLVQDVLLLLLRKLPEFRYDPQRSFRAWLRTVTLNRWKDRLVRHAPALANSQLLEAVAAPAGEDFWEADYRRALVQRALSLMQAEFQTTTWRACWECVVNGRSGAEVAAELGLTENAVYIARGRVLRRLRRELAGLWE